MIRDEFNKQSVKKVSNKEMEGIRKLGERSYYSSRIPKLRDRVKVMNFSAWFVLIVALLMAIMIVITYLVGDGNYDTAFYVYIAFTVAMFIFALLWFFVFKFTVKKTIARYQQALKEVTEKDADKQQLAYNFILKNQNGKKGE